MRSSGTICRPAVDTCDQPERWVTSYFNIYIDTGDVDFVVTVQDR